MHSDNPLAEKTAERVAPPAVLVIFGASGDLTSRKLMPAVERLALRRLLPASFSVVGVARTEMTEEGFLQRMMKARRVDDGERATAAAGATTSATCGTPSPAASGTWPATTATPRPSSG